MKYRLTTTLKTIHGNVLVAGTKGTVTADPEAGYLFTPEPVWVSVNDFEPVPEPTTEDVTI